MLLRALRNWRSRGHAPRVVLYTRPGCHLCDEMKAALRGCHVRPSFDLEEVDIETDPELLERFERSIPVLEIAGRVAFKGRLTPETFRRKYARILGEREQESAGS